jgi:hypothetical protein
VRLGPSTPGDYVRARVLVPRNPGVTVELPVAPEVELAIVSLARVAGTAVGAG